MHRAPVPEDEKSYFVKRLLPTLCPLSDSAYMLGPAVILGTLARYSYILFEGSVYWCIEWEPGLLVIEFAPDGYMAWTAIRSPVPEFGDRTPIQNDIDAYDEAAPNHQHNLVFDPWDAALDETYREFLCFVPADAQTQKSYELAISHVDSLGDIIKSKYSTNMDQWRKDRLANIKDWAGEGISVN